MDAPSEHVKVTIRPGHSWWFRISLGLIVGAVFAIGYWWRLRHPESCYQRGREALNIRDDDTVNLEADRLVQTPGYEAKGHLLKGLLLVRAGKPTQALQELEKANSESTNIDAGAAVAQCLYKLGRFVEAIDVAHATLERDSHRTDARRWLAAAFYDLGAISDAVFELKQISSEAASDPRPARLLGLIAKDSEQYKDAIEYYRESLKRDPRQFDRETILVELAESQVKLSLFEEALTTLEQCQRSATVLTWQAEAKRGLGQFDEAESLLRDATALDSRYFPARLELGKLLLDQQRIDEALKELKSAANLQQMNRIVHLQLSQALRQSGQNEQADAELTRMEQIKAIEREFTDLHDSAAQHPGDLEIRLRLGELAGQLQKPELAKMWLRAAQSIAPADPRVRAALNSANSVHP